MTTGIIVLLVVALTALYFVMGFGVLALIESIKTKEGVEDVPPLLVMMAWPFFLIAIAAASHWERG